MTTGLGTFNTREIAVLAWTTIALFWALTRKEVRSALFHVIKAFFVRRISTVLAVMAAYVSLIVFLLSKVGIWEVLHLKNTLIWFFSVAIVARFEIINISEDQDYFKKAIRDNLKLIVLIEFIISVYTFSFFVEFLIVPLVTIIVVMLTKAETNEDYAPVEKLLNFVLTLTALLLVGYAVYKVIVDFDQLATIGTLMDFVLPPMLSISLLPFLFLALTWSSYENAAIRTNFAISDPALKKYAKRQGLLKFRFNREHLIRWARRLKVHHIESRGDIDISIIRFQDQIKREKTPPDVPICLGWSPYSAKDFLAEHELKTGYYEQSGGDLWTASSPYLELDDEVLGNNIAYYVDGTDSEAKSLKLKLNINSKAEKNAAHSKFLVLAQILCGAALGKRLPKRIERALVSGETRSLKLNGKRFSVSKLEWPPNAYGEYDITFIIENI